jgi:hypothetical protein
MRYILDSHFYLEAMKEELLVMNHKPNPLIGDQKALFLKLKIKAIAVLAGLFLLLEPWKD